MVVILSFFKSQPGDQIVRLNGLTLSECTHEEFVSLVRQKKSLILAIKGE